MSMVVEGH